VIFNAATSRVVSGGGDAGGEGDAYVQTVLQLKADMDKVVCENRTLKLQLHEETTNRMQMERARRQVRAEWCGVVEGDSGTVEGVGEGGAREKEVNALLRS
jgi:hypothetical protein